MQSENATYDALRKQLLQAFREYRPNCPVFADFSGRDIVAFQEWLTQKAGGRVSEKWFYTHLKKRQEKLPREDVLDLLTIATGYESWGDFRAKNMVKKKEEEPNDITRAAPKKSSHLVLLGLLFITLFVTAFVLFSSEKKHKYQICFYDADTKQPLTNRTIDIIILRKKETPQQVETDSAACINFRAKTGVFSFIVQADYYQTDTIIRVINADLNEKIYLKTDDYALMLHLFSTGNVNDWTQRRAQLNRMISDDAILIQVASEGSLGMEIYNKQEFINKLTLPVTGLRDLQILDTQYDSQGRIFELRFMQGEDGRF